MSPPVSHVALQATAGVVYYRRLELGIQHVLANILRSRYVAITPPVEARNPGRRSNVENAPRRRPVTGQQRVQTPPSVRTMPSYRGMDASLQLGFALCCHSNATRAPITNPPNSA